MRDEGFGYASFGLAPLGPGGGLGVDDALGVLLGGVGFGLKSLGGNEFGA